MSRQTEPTEQDVTTLSYALLLERRCGTGVFPMDVAQTAHFRKLERFNMLEFTGEYGLDRGCHVDRDVPIYRLTEQGRAWIVRHERNTMDDSLATQIGELVALSLSCPTMGMGGGSQTEERAQDRWRAKVLAEAERLHALVRGCNPMAVRVIEMIQAEMAGVAVVAATHPDAPRPAGRKITIHVSDAGAHTDVTIFLGEDRIAGGRIEGAPERSDWIVPALELVGKAGGATVEIIKGPSSPSQGWPTRPRGTRRAARPAQPT